MSSSDNTQSDFLCEILDRVLRFIRQLDADRWGLGKPAFNSSEGIVWTQRPFCNDENNKNVDIDDILSELHQKVLIPG